MDGAELTLTGATAAGSLVDHARLGARLSTVMPTYAGAEPYPHAVLDDFLDPAVARADAAGIPADDPSGWINYVHFNERKYGKTDRASFPPTIGRVVDELNAPPFVAWLERAHRHRRAAPGPGPRGRRAPPIRARRLS